MAPNLQPTQSFVLLHFQPKSPTGLVMPDGSRDPNVDVVVLALGPDIPQNPPLAIGDKVLLRGDAKLFVAHPTSTEYALVPYTSITAIVRGEQENADMQTALELVNADN